MRVSAIRYYEARGLIPSPHRTEGGYRLYPVEEIDRVRMIKRAQALGFTLKEIGELLKFQTRRWKPKAAIRKWLIEKITSVDKLAKQYSKRRGILRRMLARCDLHTGTGHSILEGLGG